MERVFSRPPFFTAFAVFGLLLFSSGPVNAAELNVGAGEVYKTIQAAVTAAVAGDTIIVEPGTYQESITLNEGVDIRGRETARTFLSGNGSGPVILVNTPINAGIFNFTFINASLGIQIANDQANVDIKNNVFEVGSGGVGISVQLTTIDDPTSGIEVANNVFFQNGKAVASDAAININHNIFANNLTAISSNTTNITNNAFFENGPDGPTGTSPVTGDPLFVDPGNHDFHLQQGSPCIINQTDPSLDIGAYGGPEADTIPFPVQGLTVTATTDSSITFAWSPNKSHLVTNPDYPNGSYSIYYDRKSGPPYEGTDAQDASGTILIQDLTYTLNFVDLLSTVPEPPVLNEPEPRDGKLLLSWPTVTGATGYKVYYGILTATENFIDVEKTTSYTLAGLTNGQPYYVAVSAYSQPEYFISVTAVDISGTFESDYSQEVSARIGQIQEGLMSDPTKTATPDAIAGYPALPNGSHGCFIASAAYGSYSSPEVRVLRDFRDRYLLTTVAGRKFVEWYYRKSPAAAALLNSYPRYKPAVRALLAPVVGTAIVVTRTSGAVKAGFALVLGTVIMCVLRKKRSRPIKA